MQYSVYPCGRRMTVYKKEIIHYGSKDTIHEHNVIEDTQLIIDTYNLKQIDYLQNIIFGNYKHSNYDDSQ